MEEWVSDEELFRFFGVPMRQIAPDKIEAYMIGRNRGWEFASREYHYGNFHHWLRSATRPTC